MTTTTVDDAEAAFQAAQENARDKLVCADEARICAEHAAAAREALLTRAAAGGHVTASDLTEATEAERRAKDEYDIAAAVAAGAVKLAKQAEIPALHARARAREAEYADAVDVAVAVAAEIDADLAALRAKLVRLHEIQQAAQQTHARARAFNTATSANPAVMAMNQHAEKPRANVPQSVGFRSYDLWLLEVGEAMKEVRWSWDGRNAIIVHPLADLTASGFGRR